MFRKENQRIRTIILAVVCVLLFVFLVVLISWSRRTEALESMDLQDQATEERAGANAEEVTYRNIVCWGDNMPGADVTAPTSFQTVLQTLLTDNGYEITVSDKTIQGAGTLSIMRLAGVSEDVLQSYVSAHQAAAGEAGASGTEVEIQEFTADQLTRDDTDCIPVIFMGYYGGWNHDPNELADQQQRILETFTNQDEYIIAGAVPSDGSVDAATYDAVMTERWGEHYISLSSLTTEAADSQNAQAALADAVYAKLQELGYIG